MVYIILVNLGDGRKYSQIDDGLGLASIGLEFISTYLNEHHIKCEIIDQSILELSNKEVIDLINIKKPDIVGLNPLSNTRKQCDKIVKEIKKYNKNILTVIGGYDATFNSLSIYSNIDIIVRGQGEKAMLDIAENYLTKNFDKINGIAYKKNNKIIDNLNERADALKIDELPLPKRENIEYISKINEPVSIIASRGCIFKCKFCSTPKMYPKGREMRPIEQVLKEIDYLAKNNIKKFSFWDEDFYGSTKETIERANKIIEHIKNIKYPDGTIGGNITFSFICTTGIINSHDLKLIKNWEGTVNRLYVGIEGGCDKALKNLGNHSCLLETLNKKAIDIVRNYNIGLQIGFIMFNPYSDYEELENSAKFLKDNDEAVNSISFFHHLRPYPGTETTEKLTREELIIGDENEDELNVYTSIPYHFKYDDENKNLKQFCHNLGELSSNELISKCDRYNNDVYMKLVNLGYGKHLFTNINNVPEKVITYKEIRKRLSNQNYTFFTNALNIFKNNNAKKFEELKEFHLNEIEKILKELEKLKERI